MVLTCGFLLVSVFKESRSANIKACTNSLTRALDDSGQEQNTGSSVVRIVDLDVGGEKRDRLTR